MFNFLHTCYKQYSHADELAENNIFYGNIQNTPNKEIYSNFMLKFSYFQ